MNEEFGSAAGAPVAEDVCVAIATMDRPQALLRCLRALETGRVPPGQIIIVDQSQDSGTQQAVEQQGPSTVPVEYLRQDMRGLSASRNAAIHQAGANIIAFTDDDCVPDAAWIATIARSFTGSASIAALSGRVLPLDSGSSNGFMISPRASTTRRDFHGKSIPWLVGTGGNFAIRREWLDRVGDFDERLGAGSAGQAAEDGELIYRLLRNGARLRYEPDLVVYHELQSRERRLKSRWDYGHGIGGMCGIWLRRRDSYAAFLLLYWLSTITRELAHSLIHQQWFEAYQRWLGLRGTASGVVYGLRSRSPSSKIAAHLPTRPSVTSRVQDH